MYANQGYIHTGVTRGALYHHFGSKEAFLRTLLVGLMHTAAETSREYAMQRVAFGKPIAHHQALAFLIADMRSAVDATRILVQEAAWRADRGLGFTGAAATAFVEAVEAAGLIFIGPPAEAMRAMGYL